MKFIPFKTRLLAAFWIILILAVCLPGVYFHNALEQEIIDNSKKDAFTQLDFISWLTGRQPPFTSNRNLDEWVGTLGQKLGYRISIITASGVVIADSAFPSEEIRFMENHSNREEVIEALNNARGSSIRYSESIQRPMVYVARSIELPAFESPLILRMAFPLSSVKDRLNTHARQFLGIIALLFVLTFLASIYLSRKLRSPVHQLIEQIRAIAAGNYSHRYVLDAGQEFYQLSGAINEMADRIVRQMEIITRQKQELEAILANMREGVMLLDHGGRIKSINQTLEKMAGCHLSCIGKKPMEVFLSAELQSACDTVIDGAREYNFTITQDGEVYYEVYLLRIPEGGALVVFHNISDRKRLEKIRQDFVANVSHELKTPLTSIKGYVETLLSGNFTFPKDARSFLNTILKSTNQMSNIVNDLLQLTRLQEKPLSPNLLTINATRCFQSAWESCRPQAEGKQIALDNRLKSFLPVKAEEDALARVFENLLQNAIRYSPEGKTITVHAEEKEKEILFAIRDEGPGIPPKHQSRIFERFYRVDKERSRQSGGTGLGLAICRNAVTGMGGRIWVESPPPAGARGSIFFFTLPRPQAAASAGTKIEKGILDG